MISIRLAFQRCLGRSTARCSLRLTLLFNSASQVAGEVTAVSERHDRVSNALCAMLETGEDEIPVAEG